MNRLVLLLLLGVLCGVVVGNSPIKGFALSIYDDSSQNVQSCFLKNYDLDVEAPNDPRIFRVKDASRMAFGFDGPFDLEINDCDSTFTYNNIALDAWGCEFTMPDVSVYTPDLFQIKAEAWTCNQPGLEIELATIEFSEIEGDGTVVRTQTFYGGNYSYNPTYRTSRPVYAYADTGFIPRGYASPHIDDTYGLLGPDDYTYNLATINFIVSLDGNDITVTVRVPIREENSCLGLSRCALALEATNDPEFYLCDYPRCPPGWNIFSQHLCYEFLQNDADATGIPSPSNLGTPFYHFSGVSDCTNRRAPTQWCLGHVASTAKYCNNYAQTYWEPNTDDTDTN